MKFHDICDELVGDYPKDFNWKGWHPFCRCHAIPILPTPEEFAEYQKAKAEGKSYAFKGEVKDYPDNFKAWAVANAERITNAKSLPYFIKDNEQAFRSVLDKDVANAIFGEENRISDTSQQSAKTLEDQRKEILARAEARHKARTPDEIRRIQDLADERRYGKDYVDGIHELEKAFGIKRIKRMTHEEANTYRVNPNFGFDKKDKPYRINCSTCSGAYILRRMGFDVEALPNRNGSIVERLSKGMEAWDKWKDNSYLSLLDWMNMKGYLRMSIRRYEEFYNETCKDVGIYEIIVAWKRGGGHSTLLERRIDGTLVRIDQQTNYQPTFDALCTEGQTNYRKIHKVRGVKRVDNAMFNPKYIGAVKLK